PAHRRPRHPRLLGAAWLPGAGSRGSVASVDRPLDDLRRVGGAPGDGGSLPGGRGGDSRRASGRKGARPARPRSPRGARGGGDRRNGRLLERLFRQSVLRFRTSPESRSSPVFPLRAGTRPPAAGIRSGSRGGRRGGFQAWRVTGELMNLLEIYASLKPELDRIEEELERSIRSDLPLLSETSLHLLQAGGKRIRPVF